MEELKNYYNGFLDTALDKFKGLNDQTVIGKCICVLTITVGSVYTACKAIKAGININNKLMIGNVQNKSLEYDD